MNWFHKLIGFKPPDSRLPVRAKICGGCGQAFLLSRLQVVRLETTSLMGMDQDGDSVEYRMMCAACVRGLGRG